MITLFISTSCRSCREARIWLEENNIPYQERDIFDNPPSKDEIISMLQMTENGTEEIISTRSSAFRELNIELESLSLSELHKIIEKYPGLLRRPIIMDNKCLQVGYNHEEMGCFLPRSARIYEFKKLLERIDY